MAGVSQVGMIRNDLDVTVTFAGDNSIMALEVVRFRLRQVKDEWSTMKKLSGPSRTGLVGWRLNKSDLKHPVKLLHKILVALIYREESMLLAVGKKLAGSKDKFEGFTQVSHEMREVANAVYSRMVVSAWVDTFYNCDSPLSPTSEDEKSSLEKIGRSFVVHRKDFTVIKDQLFSLDFREENLIDLVYKVRKQ